MGSQSPDQLSQHLSMQRALALYRVRRLVDSPQAPEIVCDGRRLLSFCSNDYLGLAADPRVRAALMRGAEQWGVGAGASHLITGHQRPHQALEDELAAFVGSERTLLFSTGYMANLGLVTALADRRGEIYEDRRNHASLIDAARLARAKVHRYPHIDVRALDDRLKQAAPGRTRLITTDAVFSMDGDLAPLPALAAAAQRHDAWLIADDAHGLGVLGTSGGGSFEHWGVKPGGRNILMGTLGKAFGTFGAFVAGDTELVDYLLQRARTYTYTTALPPAVAEATRAALRIAQEEPEHRARLHAHVTRFRAGAAGLGLEPAASLTPIQPLVLGTPERVLRAADFLEQRDILVMPIRPPTVPEGAARLRITFSAAHTEQHVDRLVEALGELAQEWARW